MLLVLCFSVMELGVYLHFLRAWRCRKSEPDAYPSSGHFKLAYTLNHTGRVIAQAISRCLPRFAPGSSQLKCVVDDVTLSEWLETRVAEF
jgi:hypothetical protein